METIELDENNYLKYRLTPWDANVFQCGTNEITEFVSNDIENATRLLEQFLQLNKQADIKIAIARIDVDDRLLKHVLQEGGFHYVETMLYFRLAGLTRYNFYEGLNKKLTLTTPAEEDFPQIKNMARDAFFYSRYHEDYRIDDRYAKERYYRWIDDMRNQGKEFLVFKQKDRVASFVAFQQEDNIVDLILGGSGTENSYLTPLFWAAILEELKERNVKQVRTLVSAANIGSVKLHYKMHFEVIRTLVGFNKVDL